jgi:beta-glucosidase
LRNALDDVDVLYARGCDVFDPDRAGFEEAVDIARAADVAVVVVAGKSGMVPPVTSGEGSDATNLNLPAVQRDLIAAIAATDTPLVVVVLSGRVHTLEAEADAANALVLLFPPGEEGGNGLADVLTGRISPSGRLPVSLPRSVGQVPVHAQRRAGGERVMVFVDYIDSPISPLFPFGHGLAYTGFAYEDLELRGATTAEPIEIALTVRNTGEQSGDEVVQIYIRDDVASVARPLKMLLAFERMHLDAGEARRITFIIPPARLAFYDPDMRFVVEPGRFTVSAGSSSTDIKAEGSLTLTGEVAAYQQREVQSIRVI